MTDARQQLEILLSETETAVESGYTGILRVETNRGDRPSYGALCGEINRLLGLASAATSTVVRRMHPVSFCHDGLGSYLLQPLPAPQVPG